MGLVIKLVFPGKNVHLSGTDLGTAVFFVPVPVQASAAGMVIYWAKVDAHRPPPELEYLDTLTCLI